MTSLQNEYFKSIDERNKAMNSLLAMVKKKHGDESIMKLDGKTNMNIPVIPSGILSLDLACGVGGLPKGRIIEMYGDESAGKTTLALQYVRECQNRGGIAAFIDVEHALNKQWAKFHGVDIDNLLLSQPNCGEEALELCDDLVSSNQVGIVIVDSVAMLIPRAELEKDMGESSMGKQALLLNQAMRKLTATIAKSNCIVIFINQIRMKIGVMYGSPETTPGGMGLRYAASIRMDLGRKETFKIKDEAVGVKTKVKIIKNKVAPPFTTCEFDLYFKTGYDFLTSVIEEGIKYGVISQGGAWFTYKGQRFQGAKSVIEFLKQSPNEVELIKQQVLQKVQSEGISEKEVKLVEEPVKRRVEEVNLTQEQFNKEVKTEIEQIHKETKIEEKPVTPEIQKEVDEMITEIFSPEESISDKQITIEKVQEGEN